MLDPPKIQIRRSHLKRKTPQQQEYFSWVDSILVATMKSNRKSQISVLFCEVHTVLEKGQMAECLAAPIFTLATLKPDQTAHPCQRDVDQDSQTQRNSSA